MNFSIYAALTRELKPFEVPFLSTNYAWFPWLTYQILKYFENCLTAIEVRPGVYEKSEKQKVFI